MSDRVLTLSITYGSPTPTTISAVLYSFEQYTRTRINPDGGEADVSTEYSVHGTPLVSGPAVERKHAWDVTGWAEPMEALKIEEIWLIADELRRTPPRTGFAIRLHDEGRLFVEKAPRTRAKVSTSIEILLTYGVAYFAQFDIEMSYPIITDIGDGKTVQSVSFTARELNKVPA